MDIQKSCQGAWMVLRFHLNQYWWCCIHLWWQRIFIAIQVRAETELQGLAGSSQLDLPTISDKKIWLSVFRRDIWMMKQMPYWEMHEQKMVADRLYHRSIQTGRHVLHFGGKQLIEYRALVCIFTLSVKVLTRITKRPGNCNQMEILQWLQLTM